MKLDDSRVSSVPFLKKPRTKRPAKMDFIALKITRRQKF